MVRTSKIHIPAMDSQLVLMNQHGNEPETEDAIPLNFQWKLENSLENLKFVEISTEGEDI